MEINKLIGGLNTDVHPSSQPAHTVRDMRNMVPMSTDGNLFSIENSDGNLLTGVTYPNGFQPIGHTVLNTDVIVVLAHPDGYSQVGVIQDKDGWEYKAIAPANTDGSVPNNNPELGFSFDRPVQCESRKLINGHRMLYFTDNNRPFGRIDLDEPPQVGSAFDESSLIPRMSLPKFDYEVIDGGGNFRPGKIHIITRYGTIGGGTTLFGIPSKGIDIFREASNNYVQGGYTSEYVNNDEGDLVEDPSVSKSYRFNITNVDTDYDTLEIFVLHYVGNSDPAPKATRVAIVPINSSTVTYTLASLDTDVGLDVSIDEVFQSAIPYNKAKTIAQKDNTLFLGNLSAENADIDLQTVANNITVKYKIKQVPYCGRENTAGDSENNEPIFNRAEFISFQEARLAFYNGTIDETTPGLTDVSNYTYESDGRPAQGSITADTGLISDGDTLSLSSYGTNPQLDYTFKTTPTLANEIAIGATNDELASNIADAIINDASNLNIIAFPDGDICHLGWNNVDDLVNVTITSNLVSDDINGVDINEFVQVTPTNVSLSSNKIVLEFSSEFIYISGSIKVDINLKFEGTDTLFPEATHKLQDPFEYSSSSSAASQEDYINELVSTNYKGYRRGEIYSLGFCLLYDTGATSPVFHIPGLIDNVDQTPNDQARHYTSPTWGGGNGNLGTYVSSEEYPNDSNFPGLSVGDDNSATNAFANRGIRHHYIPEIVDEPHVDTTNSDAPLINIIGLEFEFGTQIPAEELSNVKEILFVRESRSREGNKSIFSQGVLNKMVTTCNEYNRSTGNVDGNDYSVDGQNVKGGIKALPMALGLINNWTVSSSKSANGTGAPTRGMLYPGHTDAGAGAQIWDRHVLFQGPEDVFGVIDGEVVSGGQLVPCMVMEDGNAIVTTGTNGDRFYAGITRQIGKRDTIWQFASMKASANYRDYSIDVGYSPIGIARARTIKPGNDYTDQLDSTTLKINNRWLGSGIEILLDEDLTLPPTRTFQLNQEYKYRNDNDKSNPEDKTVVTTHTGYDGNIPLRKMLYNLKSNNNAQYGNIGGEYFLCERKEIEPGGVYTDVFGGDTYITKFSLNNESIIDHWAYSRKRNDSRHGFKTYDDDEIGLADSRRIWNSDGRTIADQSNPWETGHSAFEQSYFFVESDINTYLRHRLVGETRTYFPIDSDISVYMNNRGFQGDSPNYNPQYSFGELFKRFYTTFNTQIVSKFENRIIYSNQAANDDTLDAYRVFQQNDFYDLPAHTGPIWNLFVSFNTLYAHTPKSLWKTFGEPAATLDSETIGEVLLGTGKLFQRPSQEMMTTEGGYGGTISQFGGIHTPIGYIFPDILQGRIFGVVNGGQLRELSKNLISVFLSKNMRDVIGNDLSVITTENSHNIDNPYMNIGFTGGYDYRLKMAYISKHGPERFTLGFFTDALIFTGFYDVEPSAFVQYDDRLLELKDSKVYEANKGDKNTFYGALKESIAEFVTGTENQSGKTFDNIYIDSERYDNGVLQKDSFNKVKVSTTYSESNEEDIVVAIDALDDIDDNVTRMSFTNDEFRMAFPRTVEETRIKGDNAIVKLVYTSEGKFIVKQIYVKYRVNSR